LSLSLNKKDELLAKLAGADSPSPSLIGEWDNIKPPSDRPTWNNTPTTTTTTKNLAQTPINIPVIDLQNLLSADQSLRDETLGLISHACQEWGFFQVVNHGVSHELMKRAREVWREFFLLPLEVKQEYANSPSTYEGYGSRLGVEKGAILDWSDYFFLHYMPHSLRNESKWPELPPSCRYIYICLFVCECAVVSLLVEKHATSTMTLR
jgi:hypothetical protein